MKKQIMSKRGRRFDEGGEVQNMPRARTAAEDREAEDKAAGLEASNKEKSTGFFERLRMGNIDDPNSEAYKRFGAGRGRADRAANVPVEDKSFTAVPSKEAPDINNRGKDMASTYAAVQARENAKAEGEKVSEGERIAHAMASKPDTFTPRPSMSVRPKPAKKEVDPTAGEAKDKATQAAADEQGDRPKAKVESIMKKKPVATASTFDAYNLNNFAKPKPEEEKPKSTYKKNATSSSSGKKYKKSESSDVDFAGYGLGMKRGGSVSKASGRGDGIAQRGKTRGKMC
jgi:hypothetical protein